MPEDKKEMPVDVAGLMEDAFLMGIGVLEMTREKLSGLSGELIERGKMSQSDAKKVADRISEVAGKQQSTLRGMVADETRKALEAAGVPTSDEIASLRREIAELKTMMAGSKPSGEVPTG
jgi:polyhydroxyalkanoate synthesis regulator phasin